MSARRPALHLFLFFLSLYALTSSGNAFRVPDEFEVYFQAEHLIDAGDLSVPQTLAIRQGGEPIFFGEIGRDGRPYAPYGPGVAFLILPFHLIGRTVAAVAGVPRAPFPEGIAWEFLVGGITTLAMAFAAALTVAGFFRAAVALGGSMQTARQLALILGLSTMLWPYGTTLYSEAWLTAAFVWAAWALLDARQGGPSARARVLTASVLLAAAGLTKPTALVIAPGFIVAVLFDTRADRGARWRSAVTLGVGIALAAAVQIGWNLVRFGRPLDFGYNLAGMIPILPARSFAPEDVPRGLLVQLLTPGKSLFVWAPVTLVSVLTIRDWWSRERGIGAGLLTGTALAVMFYAAFLYPEGGYAHGPRHLLPLVPLLMLPLAMPGVAGPAPGARHRDRRRLHHRRACSVGLVSRRSVSATGGPASVRSVLRADRSAARTAVEPVPDRLHPVQDGAHERALVVGGSTGWQRSRYLRAASRAGTSVDAWRLRDSCLATLGGLTSVGHPVNRRSPPDFPQAAEPLSPRGTPIATVMIGVLMGEEEDHETRRHGVRPRDSVVRMLTKK